MLDKWWTNNDILFYKAPSELRLLVAAMNITVDNAYNLISCDSNNNNINSNLTVNRICNSWKITECMFLYTHNQTHIISNTMVISLQSPSIAYTITSTGSQTNEKGYWFFFWVFDISKKKKK